MPAHECGRFVGEHRGARALRRADQHVGHSAGVADFEYGYTQPTNAAM
jgi:hypothetical protein